jgi:hypothetical protein
MRVQNFPSLWLLDHWCNKPCCRAAQAAIFDLANLRTGIGRKIGRAVTTASRLQ